MKISEFKRQGLTVSEKQEAEPGLRYVEPGARQMGSTGTLGRRACWVNEHAGPGPTGTLGRRDRGGGRGGPGEIESLNF